MISYIGIKGLEKVASGRLETRCNVIRLLGTRVEGCACKVSGARGRREETRRRGRRRAIVAEVREGNGRYPMGNDAASRINRGLRAVAAG